MQENQQTAPVEKISEKEPSPPGKDGKRIPLDTIAEKNKARVLDIQGGWARRLGQMGIHPGDEVTVVRYGVFRGPVVIEIHGFQVALGRKVASEIVVEEINE